MRQYVDSRMKATQRCYKCDHDRLICNAPKKIEVGQYVYIDQPPITTYIAEGLAAGLYCKLLSVKTRSQREIEVRPTTVAIDENGIQNTIPVDLATVS